MPVNSPTIGAVLAARYWFPLGALRCVPHHERDRPTHAIGLRSGRNQPHSGAVVLSCRPNAPFAELVRLSRTSVAADVREEQVLGE